MKFIQSYYTDIGATRKSNQDSLTLLKAETDYGEVLLAVVCDGMGGHQLGELASKLCVKRFSRWFKTKFPQLLYAGFGYEELKNEWHSLISEMNQSLVNYGKENQMELGSTITAFLFCQDSYYAVQVGDSRGYKIDNEVRQITRDHSLIALEVEKGLLSKEAAKNDKRANILVESVGITNNINMDFHTGVVEPYSCFLLCTDGFWHQLDEAELGRYISGTQIKDNKMMRIHLNFLADTVIRRGEGDNISAIGVISVEH